MQILEQKWNQLYQAGMLVNGGDPQYLENWWLALWAYNSGFYPQGSDSSGAWGVGWVNNPINPNYPPDREMFLSGDYDADIKVPSHWSYEEKVIGFAAFGLYRYSFVDQATELAFHEGVWPSTGPVAAEPSHDTFCTSDNQCDASIGDSGGNACTRSDFKCWWHEPITWATCSSVCGTGFAQYSVGSTEPSSSVPAGYPARCTTGLPSNAVIIDDVPSSDPAALGCPGQNYTSQGSMTWKFGSDGNGGYPSKIDSHQIGAGLGGHFWFTHTIASNSYDPTGIQPQSGNAKLQITGTWTPPTSVSGSTRIMVHIPNYGAWTPQANYQIHLGNGNTAHRVINQAKRTNTWVDLGIYDLSPGASVSLGNVTFKGLGYDIAWDAIAFIPTASAGIDYVAMGDSYSSGEGLQPFDPDSDYDYAGMKDACHRSGSGGVAEAYSQLVQYPNNSAIARLADDPSSNVQYHFIACSGDFTTGVTEQAVGSPEMANTPWDKLYLGYNELPQVDTGWLNSDTTLVTITVGGDDARFSSVLKACVTAFPEDCTASDFQMLDTNTNQLDPEPLIQYEPKVIDALQTHLEETYKAIATAAPNAKIIVLGYPWLFPGGTTDTQQCTLKTSAVWLTATETAWLNQMGDRLDGVIARAVLNVANQGYDVHYIDVNSGFKGHEVCSSDPWINGVLNWSYSGSGWTYVGTGSFHPMVTGQQEYAKLVDDCLAGRISC